MIIGTHFLLYSKDPEADRAFFRDVLGFPHVDAGQGWLIFAMSPAEAAIHPLEGEPSRQHSEGRSLSAALYLMCDDLEASIASLKTKKVQCTEVEKAPWGRVTAIPLPSGGSIGLYQPRHATALDLPALNHHGLNQPALNQLALNQRSK
jgi:predicted enzyme related to lactoylglutathione lyase